MAYTFIAEIEDLTLAQLLETAGKHGYKPEDVKIILSRDYDEYDDATAQAWLVAGQPDPAPPLTLWPATQWSGPSEAQFDPTLEDLPEEPLVFGPPFQLDNLFKEQ